MYRGVAMNDLEEYIAQSSGAGKIVKQSMQAALEKETSYGSKLQTANGNASLLDFIKMVGLIIESNLDDLNVEYLPYERGYAIQEDPNEPVNHPVITFRVKSRVHMENRGYKPVLFDTFQTENGKSVSVFTEYFTSLVQFDIIANEYDLAWEVMDRFEEALLAYVETIKGNGITDYFLWRQFNDDYYDNFRNTMSILNLEYRVDTERIRVIFNENIKDIITTGTAEHDDDITKNN
jgi:hypothetical protein